MNEFDLVSRHIEVTRTARYWTVGSFAQAREVWFLLHGYGQLAGDFVRDCLALATPDRVLVAPEGLSRFYLEPVGKLPATVRTIGASWMTREDRLVEIDDYIRFLDAIHAKVFESAPPTIPVGVLGFSQGTSTACRWVVQGDVRPRSLVLWAGEIPPDLDLGRARERLGKVRVTLVAGNQDRFITPKILERETSRLENAGIAFDLINFEGAHVMNAEVLRKLSG